MDLGLLYPHNGAIHQDGYLIHANEKHLVAGTLLCRSEFA